LGTLANKAVSRASLGNRSGDRRPGNLELNLVFLRIERSRPPLRAERGGGGDGRFWKGLKPTGSAEQRNRMDIEAIFEEPLKQRAPHVKNKSTYKGDGMKLTQC